MSETIVDRLYSEFQSLVSHLDQVSEPSLRSTVDENFKKTLLLAAASYFEHCVIEDILSFVKEKSSGDCLVVEFVSNKAISRQYHTFFNWDVQNANQFFGLFGNSFKTFMINEIKKDKELEEAISAFIEIGRDRNRLVHQDFGTFYLEKTADEIYQSYKKASCFTKSILNKLHQYSVQTGS